MTWTFTVQAPIMGAVRTTGRQKFVDPRYKKYHEYKQRVRLLANVAGVPGEIGPEQCVKVMIIVYWKKKARSDLDNVFKSVADALWKQDRRVNSIEAHSVEDEGVEQARVYVEVVGP